jgi:hypothetical protein
MPRPITSHLGAAQAMSSTQGAVRWTPQRAALIALLVGIVAVSAACWMNREEVQFTIENRTDSVLCAYPSPEDASGAPCLMELKPQATTGWWPGCGYGEHADELPMTVVLTVKEGGRQIYHRTEECRVWQRSSRKFVIEQRGEDFVVTDPLAETTPSP